MEPRPAAGGRVLFDRGLTANPQAHALKRQYRTKMVQRGEGGTFKALCLLSRQIHVGEGYTNGKSATPAGSTSRGARVCPRRGRQSRASGRRASGVSAILGGPDWFSARRPILNVYTIFLGFVPSCSCENSVESSHLPVINSTEILWGVLGQRRASSSGLGWGSSSRSVFGAFSVRASGHTVQLWPERDLLRV